MLTWLGDIGMTAGRTAGEFPDGVPMSGRGGMKGVGGSESSMLNGVLKFFPRFQLLSHYGLETKARGGNEWTHKERMIWRRALFMSLSGFDLELFGLLRAAR